MVSIQTKTCLGKRYSRNQSAIGKEETNVCEATGDILGTLNRWDPKGDECNHPGPSCVPAANTWFDEPVWIKAGYEC
jgi:hypothetical protein